mmetsp:Transcript_15205/g.43481  ORF Transcript_15205/g.43481 Transcript_15205/m.43481 type:complete len:204 (+) Transcript_15205:96-707(+)
MCLWALPCCLCSSAASLLELELWHPFRFALVPHLPLEVDVAHVPCVRAPREDVGQGASQRVPGGDDAAALRQLRPQSWPLAFCEPVELVTVPCMHPRVATVARLVVLDRGAQLTQSFVNSRACEDNGTFQGGAVLHKPDVVLGLLSPLGRVMHNCPSGKVLRHRPPHVTQGVLISIEGKVDHEACFPEWTIITVALSVDCDGL